MKPMVFFILIALTLTMAVFRMGYANNDGDILPFLEPFAWHGLTIRIGAGAAIDSRNPCTDVSYRQWLWESNANILGPTYRQGIYPVDSEFYLGFFGDACNMPLSTALLLLGTGLIGFVGVHRSGHQRPTRYP